LRIEDVEVGVILEGTVEKLLDKSVILKLAEGISGILPIEHSADILPGTTKHNIARENLGWQKRFKEGKKIKCRVIRAKMSLKIGSQR
jgi:ribosomal protein S1